MPFKVIQSHRCRYQLKARMQLPISDSNVCSVHIRLIGKCVLDFLLFVAVEFH